MDPLWTHTVDIATDGDWTRDALHILLCHENLLRFAAQRMRVALGQILPYQGDSSDSGDSGFRVIKVIRVIRVMTTLQPLNPLIDVGGCLLVHHDGQPTRHTHCVKRAHSRKKTHTTTTTTTTACTTTCTTCTTCTKALLRHLQLTY